PVHRRWGVEQRLHDPPGLLDAVLPREAGAVADHRRLEQHLVGRRALTALFRELHVELDPCPARLVGPVRWHEEPDPGRRVELDHELVGLRLAVDDAEAHLWWMLEDEPELGLQDGEALAGPDEERNTRPAPVVDVETQR